MRVYRYWAHRTETIDGVPVYAKIGANGSSEAAEALLDEKFRYIRRLRSGETIGRDERRALAAKFGADAEGEYHRPVCEEFIEELDPENIVTRNRYGALVLNSGDHLFIDVDHTWWRFSLLELPRFWRVGGAFLSAWWLALRGRLTPLMETRLYVALALRRLGLEGIRARVYETRKGVRLLVRDGPEPTDMKHVCRLMTACGADPFYIHMCRVQQGFRARLTPKPFRMKGMGEKVRIRYPYADPAEAEAVRAWVARYDERRHDYAVCRLIDEIGEPFTSPVIEYHDRVCGVGSGLPLA